MNTRTFENTTFLCRQTLDYEIGTKFIISNLTKVTIIGICIGSSFTLETPIKAHANQKIIVLKSFQLIKTHGGRVRNFESEL